jgi:hypothetical protein
VYCWVQEAPPSGLPHKPAGAVIVPLPFTVSASWTCWVLVAVNVAPTAFAAVIETVQNWLVPEQAPDQPVKVWPLSGVAASVTLVPEGSFCEQVPVFEWQLIPPPVTVPLPVVVTCRGKVVVDPPEKVAVTVLFVSIVTTHVVAVPEQEPPQPPNVAPLEGVSVSVTCVPLANCGVHPEPPADVQFIPDGEEVIVPFPLTEPVSVKVVVELPVKAAWMFTGVVLIVNEQKTPVGVVGQPLQPLNVAPLPGEAVRLTGSPFAKFRVQFAPPADVQLIPPVPKTVPFPVTVMVTGRT